MNPCKSTLSPLNNSYMLFTIYVTIFILRYLCVIVFMLPHFAIELACISITLFFVNFLLFLIVHQKDPGFVKIKRGKSIQKLYQNVHIDFICLFCETKKDIKTKHCHHCDRCVENFDHHCPWIRNCVGKKNLKAFIAFLSFCCIDFLYNFSLGILDYFELLQAKRRFFEYKSYHKEFGISISIVCFVCFLFTFPILYIQMSKFIKETSAYQRFTAKDKREMTLVSIESIENLIPVDERSSG